MTIQALISSSKFSQNFNIDKETLDALPKEINSFKNELNAALTSITNNQNTKGTKVDDSEFTNKYNKLVKKTKKLREVLNNINYATHISFYAESYSENLYIENSKKQISNDEKEHLLKWKGKITPIWNKAQNDLKEICLTLNQNPFISKQ